MAAIASAVVWNSAAAAAAAGVLLLLGRTGALQRRPGLRHALWILVLAKLCTPPLVRLPILDPEVHLLGRYLNAASSNQTPSLNPAPVVLDSGNPDSLVFDHAPRRTLHGIDNTYEQTTRQEPLAAARGQIQPAPAVGTPAGGGPSPAIYLCTASLLTAVGGSLILAALTLLRGRRLGRLLKNAEPGSRDLQEAASRVARLMGLSRGLSIRVVDGSVTPLLWVPLHGPMIVLPQRLLAQLTDQQLAAVIAHETAHYVRRDHWSNWFAFAVSVVFWWHPVVWIARRRLSEAQEQCCDALVLAHGIARRRTYAETLLAALDFQSGERPLAPAALPTMGSASSLRRRFELLRRLAVHHRVSRPGKLLVLSLAVLLPCIPASSSPHTTPEQGKAGSDSSRELELVLPKVIKTISENYAKMRSIEVSFEESSVDREVDRQHRSGRPPNTAGLATWIASAEYVVQRTFKARNGDFRSDVYQRLDDDWRHVETITRRSDLWTIFLRYHNYNYAEYLSSDIMRIPPVDPRDLGGLDQSRGLLEQLRRSRALQATKDNGVVNVVAEIVNAPDYGYRLGQRFTYSFDAAKNYLPTQVVRYYEDGTINLLTELSYDEAGPGKAWFLRTASQKYFQKAAGTRSVDSQDWSRLVVIKVIGRPRVNEPIDDGEFTVELPPDTRISDVRLRGLLSRQYDQYIRDPRRLRSLDKPDAESVLLSGQEIGDSDLVHLANYYRLKHLGFFDTGVKGEGLSCLSRLDNLESLAFVGKQSPDDLLRSLPELPHIYRLYLRKSRISDAGLQHLGKLPQLRVLDLNGTDIGDEGLAVLDRLPSLWLLSLRSTRITDEGLANLKHTPKLCRLDLASPKIKGYGLASLRDMPDLQELQFGGPSVTDQWLVALEPLRTVTELYLYDTRVTGEGLSAISRWARLERLSLSSSPAVGDDAVEHLQHLQQLRSLTLEETNVTPQGAARLQAALPNTTVTVRQLPQTAGAAASGPRR